MILAYLSYSMSLVGLGLTVDSFMMAKLGVSMK